MSNYSLPPFPINSDPGDFAWTDWYQQLSSFVQSISSVSWNSLNFAGSNIKDIQTRHHGDLQEVLGGSSPSNYYHLTENQWTTLTNTVVESGSNSTTGTSVSASATFTPVNDGILICWASGVAANGVSSATFTASGGTVSINQADSYGNLATYRAVISVTSGTSCTVTATLTQGSSGTIETKFFGILMLST